MKLGKYDDSGQVIVDDEEIPERWKAYFSGLFQEDIHGENEDQL